MAEQYPDDAHCIWTEDDDEDNWDTSCGQRFTLDTDGPVANGMAYCCYCGRILKESTAGTVD